MSQQTKRSVRGAVLALAFALGGAALGLSAAGNTAAAAGATVDGWSCFGTDRCHSGTRECCYQYDHCSTMCPVEVE